MQCDLPDTGRDGDLKIHDNLGTQYCVICGTSDNDIDCVYRQVNYMVSEKGRRQNYSRDILGQFSSIPEPWHEERR